MPWVKFQAIFRKELIEVRRGVRWHWLMGLVAPPIILGQIVYNEVAVFHGVKAGSGHAAQQTLGVMVTLTLLFLGPFTVPSWTNMSLTRVHYRDRSQGTFVPVLCTGIQPGLYWIGRLAAAFCGAYVMLLFSVIEGMLLIQFYFKMPLAWSFSMWAGIFISSPLVSLCAPAFGHSCPGSTKPPGLPPALCR